MPSNKQCQAASLSTPGLHQYIMCDSEGTTADCCNIASSHLDPAEQCCCQGLETQGWGKGQGLDVQGRGQGRDFPRGQQHCKHRVSNKRPGLLEIQSCQSTSHTLVTSQLPQHLPHNFRGLELPRMRTRTRTCSSRTKTRTWAPRTRTWKLVHEDPLGQGLSLRTTTLQQRTQTEAAFTLTSVPVTGIRVHEHKFARISVAAVHTNTDTLRVWFSLVRVVLCGFCF